MTHENNGDILLIGLENSVINTLKVAEGPDDQLVFRQKPDKSSAGAEKLSQKFITHAFAKGRKADEENVTIVFMCHIIIDREGSEAKHS